SPSPPSLSPYPPLSCQINPGEPALGLIMGKRADTKVLYVEGEKCIIEGVFDVQKYGLETFYETFDIDQEEELIVRREITPTGKSRAFINDTPVKLKALQTLSSELIDLHQQFDTLDLNEVSFQLKMLDALADNKARLHRYLKEYKKYRTNKRQLAELEEKNRTAANEAEFIAFQLKELIEADLENLDQASLEEEINRLNNAEGIKKTLQSASQTLLTTESSIISQLEEVFQALGEFRKVDSQIATFADRLNSNIIDLQDMGEELETVSEEVEYDPQRIEEIQSRLDQVYRLQSKYYLNSAEELLALQNKLQAQADGFDNLDIEIQELKTIIDEQEAKLIELAKELSKRRKSVVMTFEKKVSDRLALLAMEHAQLKIEFNVLKDLGPSGWDEVKFLFAANKGSKLQQIKDVASGGELSRLALVTKSLVASAIPLPTLIFDEIDSGISGDVALKMGNILRNLSDEHQVVCITHSPQIASKADSHFFVYKKVKKDRTVTRVKVLDEEGKVYSIATMLSQDPPSESALINAKELIEQK
ncbi:MAG: DNA repair protein RecN, partial [Bacteroidota bacterium]